MISQPTYPNPEQSTNSSPGSRRGTDDSAVTPLERRTYSPFGAPAQTSQTPFGFTGEMTDPNGLVYLRSRYYNPTLGVFPSLDPLEGTMNAPMSLNRYDCAQNNPVNGAVSELGWHNPYAYANGNPTNLVDPSGMLGERPEWWSPCPDKSFMDSLYGYPSVPTFSGINPGFINTGGTTSPIDIACRANCAAIALAAKIANPRISFSAQYNICVLLACGTSDDSQPSGGFILPPPRLPQPGYPSPEVTISEGARGANVDFSVPCYGESDILYRVSQGPFTIYSVDEQGGRGLAGSTIIIA